MGISRKSRESEKILKHTIVKIMDLSNCVWYGDCLIKNAEEHVDSIIIDLENIIKLMKEGK